MVYRTHSSYLKMYAVLVKLKNVLHSDSNKCLPVLDENTFRLL
jgi:hypothetical protein